MIPSVDSCISCQLKIHHPSSSVIIKGGYIYKSCVSFIHPYAICSTPLLERTIHHPHHPHPRISRSPHSASAVKFVCVKSRSPGTINGLTFGNLLSVSSLNPK